MTAPPDNEVLSARALVKSYSGSPALRGVSLSVREGEILAVTGPRGCGKSTLLNCLSGHHLPDEGEVWFGDVPVHALPPAAREKLRREHFGWIGTEPELVPELTVRENTALPLLLGGASHTVAKTMAQEWLERLDIADCARKRPAELLQAQRQRVSIARALVTGPVVLFADEPTAPLHRTDRGQILRTLTAACRSHGITIVLTTDDREVAACADRSVALVDGCRESSELTLVSAPVPVAGVPAVPDAVPGAGTAAPGKTASGTMAPGKTTSGTAVVVSDLKGADQCSSASA